MPKFTRCKVGSRFLLFSTRRTRQSLKFIFFLGKRSGPPYPFSSTKHAHQSAGSDTTAYNQAQAPCNDNVPQTAEKTNHPNVTVIMKNQKHFEQNLTPAPKDLASPQPNHSSVYQESKGKLVFAEDGAQCPPRPQHPHSHCTDGSNHSLSKHQRNATGSSSKTTTKTKYK